MPPPQPILRLRLLAMLLLALLHSTGLRTAAQDPGTAGPGLGINGWMVNSWEASPDRPDSSATSMVQDAAGYLWFGTFRGLVRFDGSAMKVFRSPEEPGLPDDSIINLHVDRAGRTWVSTAKGMAAILPDGTFDRVGHSVGWPRDSYVRSWMEASDGTLNAVTFEREVVRFTGRRWETLPRIPGPDWQGVQLDEEPPGRLVGVRQTNAFAWTGTSWSAIPRVNLARDGRVLGACAARDGGRWFLTDKAILRRKDGQEVARRPFEFWSDSIWSMSEDSDGNLWIASNRDGLLRVAPDGARERFGTSTGLAVDDFRFVFEDRQRVRWVGTSGGGLLRFQPRIIRALGGAEGLSHTAVQTILEEPDHSVLVGTQGGGVFRWDGSRFVRPAGPGWDGLAADAPFASSLTRDHLGDYWMSIGNGFLAHISQGTRTVTRPVGEEFKWLSQVTLFQESGPRLWMAFDRGVLVRENGAWKGFGTNDETLSSIRSFAQAPGGGPVFAGSTRNGLFAFSGDGYRHYGTPDGLPSDSVRSLCFDRTGSLWIATDRGFARWRTGVIRAVKPQQPFNPDAVGRMLEDRQGRLWIGTSAGLVAVSLEPLNAACDGTVARIPFHVFNRTDGLPFNEFPPAAAALSDGRLWFGTIRGVAAVDPARLGPARPETGVRIEDVIYADAQGADHVHTIRPGEPDLPVAIPPDGRRIRVRYTAFDTTASHLLRFDYRIEDRDPAWLDGHTAREIAFNALPSGDHRLRVRATNADGILDPREASVLLQVEPYFWEARWFQATALLALAGTVAGVVSRIENRRLATRREILAREEALLRERSEAFQQQVLFRRLLDQSREGIYVLALEDGRFLDANETALRMLGYPREELLRLRAPDIAVPDAPLDWAGQADRLRKDGHLTFESRQRRRDGALLPVEVDIVLASITGRDFIMAFVTDITERLDAREKQAALERQLREAQKMEAIGCLAGGVAHDFNNLLQAIGGFAELARLDGPARERDEHLVEIGRTVARATQLTRQLLAFSRKHEAEMRQTDLNDVVERSVRLLARLLGADVRIRFHAAAGLPRIRGDGGLLDQVLLNLAVNARDAMPAGGELEISTGEAAFGDAGAPSWARPGRFVRLTVRDTGSGIDPALIERIFEPFFTTKPQGKGTGLGLAVVYGNVQQHDGFIRVDSSPGVGTAFEIYFPVLAAASAERNTARIVRQVSDGGTLLFCDDEPGVRKAGQMILEGAGFKVVAVGTGEEAVRVVTGSPETFALVVIDVLMPGLTGPDAVRAIRAVLPDMPVLFITGFSGVSLTAGGALPENTSLLHKPYTRTELIAAVQAHLRA